FSVPSAPTTTTWAALLQFNSTGAPYRPADTYTKEQINAMIASLGGGSVTGSGTTNNLTKWTGTSSLGNAVAGTDYPGLSSANTFTQTQSFSVAPILSSFAQGRIPVIGASGLLSQDSTLNWDATNKQIQFTGMLAVLLVRPRAADSEWTAFSSVFTWSGVHDDTICFPCYNQSLVASNQPQIGYNYEPRYQNGAPPNGLLEINLNFTGLPGVNAVAPAREVYRPETFNVDLNNNRAVKTFNLYRFSVWDKTQGL